MQLSNLLRLVFAQYNQLESVRSNLACDLHENYIPDYTVSLYRFNIALATSKNRRRFCGLLLLLYLRAQFTMNVRVLLPQKLHRYSCKSMGCIGI
jgi:hypothetical protein